MKVIHCPRRFTQVAWGGTETCILNLARVQQQQNIDVSVFTSQALDSTTAEQIQSVSVRRFKHQYPFLGLAPSQIKAFDQSGGNLLSWSLFQALMQEPDLALLHAHTGKRMGAIIRTVARLRRLPYVITLHGGHLDVPHEIMTARLAHAPTGWEWGKAPGALLGSRRVLDDASAIFCVGKAEQQAVAAQFPHKRVEYLPNGVDLDHFQQAPLIDFRAQHGIAAAATLLLSVGRIDPQKNQLSLLAALAELHKVQPNAHLLMIGHITNEAYAEDLRTQIIKRGLTSHVTLLPGIQAQDPQLVAAYHAADVFCLPSIHEPFGIVILEAWAAGLPVIASPVGGIPGFTRHNHNIHHVETPSPAAWAQQINGLLSDQSARQRVIANGLIEVQQHYDWKKINQQVTGVYNDLVGSCEYRRLIKNSERTS
jgi:glycosyltransferase involved in cell wall biosynthesis